MLPLTFDELFDFLPQWRSSSYMLPSDTGVSRHLYFIEYLHGAEIVKEIYRVTSGNLRRVRQFMD